MIVVFNQLHGTFDTYKDLSQVGERLDMSSESIERRLKDGMYWQAPLFIGYAEDHKSNRGGNRTKKD